MSNESLSDWSLSVRRLIAEIDRPQLLRTLIDELAVAVAFDTWFMAVFHTDGPPLILDYLGMENRQETYAEGPYLLDPYYTPTWRGAIMDASPCASSPPTISPAPNTTGPTTATSA